MLINSCSLLQQWGSFEVASRKKGCFKKENDQMRCGHLQNAEKREFKIKEIIWRQT